MSVYLSPIGNGFQFFDSNGKPLNAGLLNTYAAGGTTPTNTFTTSTGNVANANPIVLGTDGRPPQEIWFTAGTAYKFVLTDSLSNTLGTYDNLYGIGDPSAPNVASQYFSLTSIGGSANAVTAAAPSALTALALNQIFIIVPSATNTSTLTLTITPSGGASLGAKNVFTHGAACAGGEFRSGIPSILQYDGTQFNIIGGGLDGFANQSANTVLSGPTTGAAAQPTFRTLVAADVGTTGTTSSTFTWNGSGGTSGSITLTWQKIGNWVTLNIPTTTATTGTGSNILVSGTALAASVRPAAQQDCPVTNLNNNGAGVSSNGVVRINTDGTLNIFRDFAGTAFTNGASAGIGSATNVTYFIG